MAEKTAHYYGDLVRKLFLSGAVLMLVMLPFMNPYLQVPLYVSIFVAVIIGIIAGITNPKQMWAITLNFLVAVGASMVFEYQAVIGYTNYSIIHIMFWGNQILAIDFLVALYYSTKTVRGMLVK